MMYGIDFTNFHVYVIGQANLINKLKLFILF